LCHSLASNRQDGAIRARITISGECVGLDQRQHIRMKPESLKRESWPARQALEMIDAIVRFLEVRPRCSSWGFSVC
jgi:hypothetical protein